MIIVVIGAGYVGLTTGACLAELGHRVTCVDIDGERVARLMRNELPIYEPGLAELIGSQRLAGRLDFSTDAAERLQQADAVFLAVGTPSDADGRADLSFVHQAARDIAPHLAPDAMVVLKSTVVPGTACAVREIISRVRGRTDIFVGSNPEFLREGSAITDFMNADRIVVGADQAEAAARLKAIYAPLAARGVPMVVTSTINAELIKYTANAFLALKLGFINDVADLCEAVDGDVGAIIEGIGLDKRIGPAFLSPGPGFGGSCFPKDTRAFASAGREAGAPQTLIETLIARNEERKRALARRIIGEAEEGAIVAVLGTAFKANTDDMREAAALTIVPMLHEAGLSVRLHDPKAHIHRHDLPEAEWCETAEAALDGADVAVVLTEWDEYRRLEPKKLARIMTGRTIIDYRNLLDGAEVVRQGFRYVRLGRAAAPPLAERQARAAAGGRRVELAASPAR